ncbi:MAG: penicillin-binding protein [Oscillospiraceae bacterium]|jgi:peptidoglycan glycosyltransferase|nr:penicillin-binding protein [Oscillospiraceae bacterium]
MKNTRKRSIIVLLLTLSFLCGLGFYSYKLTINAKNWAFKPINAHLSMHGLTEASKILDRNDVVLAQSIGGQRIYHEDEYIRRAMLHSVGDEKGYISTAIQNLFKPELFGYNFITGINLPTFLKNKQDIKLNLDSNLCKLALQKFGDKKGAASIYNYKTGEIICMLSTPTYDINHPPDIKNEKTENYEGVYLNKVLSGCLTPGSIFKIITAISAIDNLPNWDSKTFECHSKEIIESEKITCMASHGKVNLKDAMKESCNIFFGNLAIELGAEKMQKTANSVGFNKPVEVDGIKTNPSLYDLSNASKASIGWSGIGQHKNLLNPAHTLTILGAIANEGTAIMPKIVKHDAPTQSKTYISCETANKIKEIMRYNVKNKYGDSLFPGLEVCAKTGTAEIGEGKEPHAWMVGFSSTEEDPFAFVVVVENAGLGRKIAAPIASALMNAAAKCS